MKINRQNGMTGIGWLLVLGLIGFFTLAGLRVIPMYIEGYKVRSALNSLNKEPNITRKSPAEIVRMLQRRFDVDDVKSVTKDDIVISRGDGRLLIEIEYEDRRHFMSNLDLVAVFKEKAEFIQH